MNYKFIKPYQPKYFDVVVEAGSTIREFSPGYFEEYDQHGSRTYASYQQTHIDELLAAGVIAEDAPPVRKAERQTGVYWVKFRQDGPWFAKHWSAEAVAWLNSDSMRPAYNDQNFAEINETRIPTPDEPPVARGEKSAPTGKYEFVDTSTTIKRQ